MSRLRAQGTIEGPFGKPKQTISLRVSQSQCFAQRAREKINRAQGTIEYLVLIAVIIVILLFALSIFIDRVGTAGVVLENATELKRIGSVNGISLSDVVVGPDSNGLIVLKNVGTDLLTVDRIVVDGEDHNYSQPLVNGSEAVFDLNNVSACDGEKKSYDVKVYYTSANNLDKLSDFQTITVKCLSVVSSIVTPISEVPPISEAPINNWEGNEDWNNMPCKNKTGGVVAVTLVDISGDGLPDLFTNSCAGSSGVLGYKNTGTRAVPVWTYQESWIVTALLAGVPYGTVHGRVAFGDLNGDGLKDAAYGSYDTYGVYFAMNNGTSSDPAWVSAPSLTVSIGGQYTYPALVDLDNDGLLDLVVVDTAKAFYAFKNTGTSSAPIFTRQTSWDANLLGDAGSSAPSISFADLDDDGDNDFLVAYHYLGGIYAYENTGDASSPVWTRNAAWDPSIVQGSTTIGRIAGLSLVDMDGDGYEDIFASGRVVGGQDYTLKNKGNIR